MATPTSESRCLQFEHSLPCPQQGGYLYCLEALLGLALDPEIIENAGRRITALAYRLDL
jgi:hypothetical protein